MHLTLNASASARVSLVPPLAATEAAAEALAAAAGAEGAARRGGGGERARGGGGPTAVAATVGMGRRVGSTPALTIFFSMAVRRETRSGRAGGRGVQREVLESLLSLEL